MIFVIALLCAAALLVLSPVIFSKLRILFRKACILIDKLVDWIERKQFERLVDRAGR